MTKIRIVDLFSGIGGLRQGAIKSLTSKGYKPEVIFTSEIKPSAIQTHQANWETETIHGDITKIDAAQIPAHDLLLAGFPCQAFSTAGLQKGFEDKTKGTLFFDVLRIINHHQPEHFILENVEGLITHDRDPKHPKSPTGRTLNTIISSLEHSGYHVDWNLLEATNHGIPQRRKRVFIIGSRTNPVNITNIEHKPAVTLKHILEPYPEVSPETKRDKAFQDKLLKHYTTEELTGKIIRNNRGGPNNIHAWDFDFYGPVTEQEKEFLNLFMKEQKRVTHAKRKNVTPKEKLPLNIQDIQTFYTVTNLQNMLDNLTRMRYLTKKDNEYTLTGGKLSFAYSHILDPEGTTPTIVASDADRLAIPHKGRLRRFTQTELKRLFGFPDNYKIPETLNQRAVFDLFGNSVVVDVAEAVTDTLY